MSKKILICLSLFSLLQLNVFALDKVTFINKEIEKLKIENNNLLLKAKEIRKNLKSSSRLERTEQNISFVKSLKEKNRLLHMRKNEIVHKINELERVLKSKLLLEKYKLNNDIFIKKKTNNPILDKKISSTNLGLESDVLTKKKNIRESKKLSGKRLKDETKKISNKKFKLELEREKAKRLADEKAKMEAKRLADEMEAKRLADEMEAKRLADEMEAKRLADEMEAKRLADEKAKMEAKRLADEKAKMEAKRLAEKRKRLKEERKKLKIQETKLAKYKANRLKKIRSIRDDEILNYSNLNGEELAKSLKLIASEKTKRQWALIFGNSYKERKYKINRLSDENKILLKKYLMSHSK